MDWEEMKGKAQEQAHKYIGGVYEHQEIYGEEAECCGQSSQEGCSPILL